MCVVIVIQSAWRGMKARRRAKRRRHAAELIRRCHLALSYTLFLLFLLPCVFINHFTNRLSFFSSRFIKGFIYRHEEYCPENEYFLDHVRYSFLKKLSTNLPRSVLDKSWLTPPPSVAEVFAKVHSTQKADYSICLTPM